MGINRYAPISTLSIAVGTVLFIVAVIFNLVLFGRPLFSPGETFVIQANAVAALFAASVASLFLAFAGGIGFGLYIESQRAKKEQSPTPP
jgi:C4-dicarboxylate transporter